MVVNEINCVEPTTRRRESGSLHGEPQNCVITVKEVGRLEQTKTLATRSVAGTKGGCNLKQSAVVQSGRGRGHGRAPRRLLIWRVAPPRARARRPPLHPMPRWRLEATLSPRRARPASHTAHILIANLPDNVQIDNGIILSSITNYEEVVLKMYWMNVLNF